MKISKISNSEFSQNSIASLPIRPNESSKYGKAALSGEELKSMFDKNTELLRNRINSIIDYISGQGEYGIGSEISTGIPDLPTLKSLCEGVLDGSFAATLTLTEEYTLLDFATKLISLVHPDSAVEFIKIEEKDGAFSLPSVPYEGHESAIYLLPSADSLSLFDCYTWDEGWQIWSTGSLQKYISELESMVQNLRSSVASKSEVNYLRLYKADDYDVNSLKMKLDALCAGAPVVYNSSFSSLVYDDNADLSKIHVITKKGDEAFGYWCYYDGETWQKGGTYINTPQIMGSVRKYSNSPASCSAIKAYVDEVIYDSLDHFAISFTGMENMFDKSAVETGKIASDGSITYDTSYITTDYMDITAVFDFFCSCTSASDVPRTTFGPNGIMFYKFDKTPYTSSYQFRESSAIECPITINRTDYPLAAYVRLSFDSARFHQVSKIMINSGKKVQSYSPYFEYRLDIDSEMKNTSTLPVTNKAICNYVEKKARRVGFVFGDGCDYPVFDTENNKLIFNKKKSEGEWGIVLDGVTYHLESASSLEIDISPAMTETSSGTESDRGIIYLNATMLTSQSPTTNQSRASCFFVRDADFATTDTGAIPIATFKRSDSGFSAWMNCPFFIDDKLFGIAKDTDELFEKLGECEARLSELDERSESALQTAQGVETAMDTLTSGQAELKERIDGIDTTVEALDSSLYYFQMSYEESKINTDNSINYFYETIGDIDTYVVNSKNGLIIYNQNVKYNVETIPLTDGVPILSLRFNGDYLSVLFSGELYIPKQSVAPVLKYDTWSLIPVYYGDDCSNGVFTPRANVEYLLKFSYLKKIFGEVHIISE